jgi:hypothetical protein
VEASSKSPVLSQQDSASSLFSTSGDGGAKRSSALQQNGIPQTLYWNGRIHLEYRNGWVSCDDGGGKTLRLCWLPKVLRGHAHASNGTIFAVGAKDGQMTILDFAGTLQMYGDLGVLE